MKTRSLLCASGLMAALLGNVPAHGQVSVATDDPVLQLEPVRVYGGRILEETYQVKRSSSALRTDALLIDVPQSVTVVSRDLIDDLSMRGMADVVTYVPGATMAQGEGNRDTPVLRGNSSTASFFVDGVRDDVQYMRDLYNVDRVEALKGPNALIFGNGSPGGVINRVTRQPIWISSRELTMQGGSEGERRISGDIAQVLGENVAVRIAAMYENSDTFRHGVSIERRGINPTFAWKLGNNTSLRLGYENFHDERVADRGVPSFQGSPLLVDPSQFFGSPELSVSDAKVDAFTAHFEHRFANDVVIRNATRFAEYEKFYQNVFPGAVNAAGTSVAISAYNNATDRANFFNQTDVVFAFSTGDIQHSILVGAELGRQVTDNLRHTGYFTSVSPTATSFTTPLTNPVVSTPITFRQSATDADNHGVLQTAAAYVQDQVAFTDRLTAVLGARLEYLDIDFRNNRTGTVLTRSDDLLSPRAGLIYKPLEQVSVYASYSMTNQPRSGEQLASLTATNQALAPEKFINREIGAKWDVTRLFAVTAAVFQLDRTNVAITDPADPTRSLLVDGQSTEGFEFGFAGRLSKKWSVIGGYAYQDGEIERTQSATVVAGARLAQLPRHTASLWTRYDFNRTWGVGLGVTHRGGFFASTDNNVTVPGFTRLDGALFYNFSRNLRAQLNVENLLDRDYFASAHSNNNITPGSPRVFRASLTTRF
jgi:catecholate siderophore receptor